jgi:predicted nucleotidyltransferase
VVHLLASIANAFVENSAVEAVSLGGSTALQRNDDLSDYDLYVYSRTPVPLEFREKIISSRARHYQLDQTFWELEDDWTEPNDAEFNVMYRSCQEAEEEIERRLKEHVASLGYTTAWCFSISHSQILADPNGWFARLQRKTHEPYPAALAQAILRKNRPVLSGGIQGCYLKQIRAAIVRRDSVSLNHRVAVWLASYFDILFAINGRFHPGEKRLLIYAEELPILPERALTDVDDLCALAGKLDQGIIDHVGSMLARLDKTIARP